MAKKNESQTQTLPEISCLLIGTPDGKIKVESLDEFESDDEIAQVYTNAIEKHGERNVRYCKVVGVKVKRTVEFF